MVYFREVQRLWSWLLVLLAIALPVGILANALHRALGSRLAHKNALYLACGSLALLAVWFFLARLITEVRETALSIRFFLLWSEEIVPWSEIRQAEAVTYRPLEYGGWGVRWGADGRAYSVSGNRGVRLRLASGVHLLVGSQRAGELAQAIIERLGASRRPSCYNP